MRQYLADQKKAHRGAVRVHRGDGSAHAGDRRPGGGHADKIKTPEHVARMNEDFRKEVLDYDGPDALKRCQAYAQALVEIGGNQDELVGRMPLGGEGPAAAGGHPASPWTPAWRRSPRKSAPGRRRRCATPPTMKGRGINLDRLRPWFHSTAERESLMARNVMWVLVAALAGVAGCARNDPGGPVVNRPADARWS